MGSFADSLLANNVERPSCPQQYVHGLLSGIAFVGASVIAVTPDRATAIARTSDATSVGASGSHKRSPHARRTALGVRSSKIFTFPGSAPAVRPSNQIDDIVTLSVGLAGSAVGSGPSRSLSIPSTSIHGRPSRSLSGGGTTAKGDASATADKPDHPRLKLPKKDAANSGAFVEARNQEGRQGVRVRRRQAEVSLSLGARQNWRCSTSSP